MIDWPLVALLLGTGGLALGFRALQMSARRVASLDALDGRIRKLEALIPNNEPPIALPRGLPGRMR